MNFKILFFVFIILSFMSCGVHYPKNQEVNLVNLSQERTFNKEISDDLNEISGLLVHEDDFVGFNDSGGEAAIYFIPKEDPTKISKSIQFKNIKNIDFESIAESETDYFVGDFGNNRGNRKDLKIYIISKSDITLESEQIVITKTIEFSFPEQTNFNNLGYDHNFDVEAMFFLNNELHIFTKEWARNHTSHYVLNAVEGNQTAKKIEEYNTSFVVTGASTISNGKTRKVALTGYTKKGIVYIIEFNTRVNTKHFFNESPIVYKMGFSGNEGQVEGVDYKNFNEICWSAERFKKGIFDVKQHIACTNLP